MADPKSSQSDFGARTETAITTGDKAREHFKQSLTRNWRKATLWLGALLLIVWAFVYIPVYRQERAREEAASQPTEPATLTPPRVEDVYPSSITVGRAWSEWVWVPPGYHLEWNREENVGFEVSAPNWEETIEYPRDLVENIHAPEGVQVQFHILEDDPAESVTLRLTYTPLNVAH